jgi:large subunit ribosomal protein L22
VTEVQAVAKYVRISPRKARLVVDHIRGRSVPEARTVLAFSERAAAREVSKVLRSAIANAETNPSLHWDGDELVVSGAFVDEGPTIKRWRARARGRVSRINKRTCHITIRVALPGGMEEVALAPPPPAPVVVAEPEPETAEAELAETDEAGVEETDEVDETAEVEETEEDTDEEAKG